ncbi:hypothetical protein [Cupriavidus necator]
MGKRYQIEIIMRHAQVGGGWRLSLIEDGVEVGAGRFPADPDADPEAKAAWLTALDDDERADWALRAGSYEPGQMWAKFLSDQAYAAAEAEGRAWLGSR